MLNRITRGIIKKPYAVVIYGPDGVGKTSFAAGAPKPIFLGTEQGSNNLDVARFPTPRNWLEVKQALKELLMQSHDFKSLAIDSIDWMMPLLHRYVCEQDGAANMELAHKGYGKAYNIASEHWVMLKDDLDALRDKRQMNIILIGHMEIKSFNDPETQIPYDRYQLKLRPNDSAMFREWADAVLFANYETIAATDKNDKTRTLMVSSSDRKCRTVRRAGWDAKNRMSMPEEIELTWKAFDDAAQAGAPVAPTAEIIERINAHLATCADGEFKKQVEGYVATCTDAARLLEVEKKVLARMGTNNV